MTRGTGGLVTVTLNAALDQTLECPGFTAGAVNRVLAQTITAGGKGINVAAFLAGRCPSVTATGFLGRDNIAPFEALFRDRGIHDRCLRLPGASRVNSKVVDRPGQKVTDINLPGLDVSPEALADLFGAIDALAEENHWFVLAGSVPSGAPEDIYAELVRRLHARGCFVAVDASGAALRHAVAARPDMIKPNQHELSELLGKPLPLAVEGRDAVLRAARDLQRSGIALVVVSLGADGAVFVDSERALLAVPPPIEVASTVGAGDALVAGILAARLQGGDLFSCARLGTAFAAGKLGQVGPVLPEGDRIKALMEAVHIETLDGA